MRTNKRLKKVCQKTFEILKREIWCNHEFLRHAYHVIQRITSINVDHLSELILDWDHVSFSIILQKRFGSSLVIRQYNNPTGDLGVDLIEPVVGFNNIESLYHQVTHLTTIELISEDTDESRIEDPILTQVRIEIDFKYLTYRVWTKNQPETILSKLIVFLDQNDFTRI